jgi:hypothetical protein
MSLILQKLSTEKVLLSASSKLLLSQITCSLKEGNCMLRKCDKCKDSTPNLLQYDGNKQVVYHQWEKKKKRKISAKTKKQITITKTIKGEHNVSLQELINILNDRLPKYMKHVFNYEHQHDIMENKRKNLTSEELYLWVDFAENWMTKYATEIQSVHFGGSRLSITLHTAVGYSSEATECFCTLAECDHGPPEIMAHMAPVISKLLAQYPETNQIHFQSDSPVSQYRGKDMFAYMVEVMPAIYPTIDTFTWNYTEAGHGKGPVDGVGATVKRNADNEVAKGKDIDTFDKFVDCSKKIKKVTVEVVTSDEIQVMKNYKIHPKPFKGTFEVHQLTWARTSPSTLFFNRLSCFDCLPGTRCSHFHLGTLEYSSDILEEAQGDGIDNPIEGQGEIEETQADVQPQPLIKKNDWVSLTLSGNKYPG